MKHGEKAEQESLARDDARMVIPSPPPFDNFAGKYPTRLSRRRTNSACRARPRIIIPQHLRPSRSQRPLSQETAMPAQHNRYRRTRTLLSAVAAPKRPGRPGRRSADGGPGGRGGSAADSRSAPTSPALTVAPGRHRHVLHGAGQFLHRAQGPRQRLAALRCRPFSGSIPLVLLASSVTIQWRGASWCARTCEAFPPLVVGDHGLGLLFLAGQMIAWRQLCSEGVFLATNPEQQLFLPADGRARRAFARRHYRPVLRGVPELEALAHVTADGRRDGFDLLAFHGWAVGFSVRTSDAGTVNRAPY